MEWENLAKEEKQFEDFQNLLDEEEQDAFLKNLEKTGKIDEGAKPSFYYHDEQDEHWDFLEHYVKQINEVDSNLTDFEVFLILKDWADEARWESNYYLCTLENYLESSAKSFCRANKIRFWGDAKSYACEFLEDLEEDLEEDQ